MNFTKKPKNKKKLNKTGNTWEVVNKKKNLNFDFFKKWEVGIILKGMEVKNILQHKFDFQNSYITFDPLEEVYLNNFKIMKIKEEDSKKKQYKLLLHRSEIKDLIKQVKEKKYIVIPTKIYLKNKKIKLEIALAKGLRKFEKKRKIIERDLKKNKLR